MKERIKNKKKKHRLYAAIVLSLGIAIIALTIILLFHVQKIEIKGNGYCTEKEIQSLVQSDKLSTNALYAVGKYAIGRGETLPCLESIKVTLKRPWVLKVTIEEKTIVGYLYDDKEYTYFDKDGLVVRKGTMVIEGVPCVEGIDVKNMKLYEKLECDNSTVFEEILVASEELKKYELSTEKIVFKNGNICLYIGDICVNLGTNVTSEKVAQIPPILEKLGKNTGTLHLENYASGKGTITFTIEEDVEEDEEAEEGEEGTKDETTGEAQDETIGAAQDDTTEGTTEEKSE